MIPSEIDVLAILFVAGVLAVGLAVAPLHHWDAAPVLASKLCLVAPGEGHQGRIGRRAPEKLQNLHLILVFPHLSESPSKVHWYGPSKNVLDDELTVASTDEAEEW